jgi:hypothetical protein
MTVSGGTPNTTVSYGTNLASNHGNLLRLIVVGIKSVNAKGSYTGNGNGTDAHLVFQFQNLPFMRQMETTNTNANGYLGSAMRAYLTGAFLTGLKNAGVPDSVLWAPTRYVANAEWHSESEGDTQMIQDKLWLPTVWEMFGDNQGRANDTYETAANQARLEYYTSDQSRTKWHTKNNSSMRYWLASPVSSSDNLFCNVLPNGAASIYYAGSVGGCAPAFPITQIWL